MCKILARGNPGVLTRRSPVCLHKWKQGPTIWAPMSMFHIPTILHCLKRRRIWTSTIVKGVRKGIVSNLTICGSGTGRNTTSGTTMSFLSAFLTVCRTIAISVYTRGKVTVRRFDGQLKVCKRFTYLLAQVKIMRNEVCKTICQVSMLFLSCICSYARFCKIFERRDSVRKRYFNK